MTSDDELAALQQYAQGKTVLELGSWHGRSTLALATTAKTVHAVDWFRGDPHAGHGDTLHDYLNATRDVPNIVTHIGRFDQVLPVLALAAFGLIFIDGYHTHEQVRADSTLALPLLARNGILAFHDYGLDHAGFGVTRAVDELFTVHQLVNTLAIVKPDARQIHHAA